MTPRILIFSIAMDVDNSFYVKFIATFALTFFGYIISVLAMGTKEPHKKFSGQVKKLAGFCDTL
jgi:hypothetical protein